MDPADDNRPVIEPLLVCEELDIVSVTRVLFTLDVKTA